MTVDLGLINSARQAIACKARHHITPAILLAVVQQESHGMPYFVDTKPGSQYKANIYGAIAYNKKIRKPDGTKESHRVYTGLTESDIRKAITLPAKIGNFAVPSAMLGQLAKFRFEYGYWEKYSPEHYPHLTKIERFYYSSSWGLVQFMGPNISKDPTPQGIEFIRRFSADISMQLLYGAGMIDGLLNANHGDVEAMYRAYNSGDPHCSDPIVIERAKSVAHQAQEIARFLTTRTK